MRPILITVQINQGYIEETIVTKMFLVHSHSPIAALLELQESLLFKDSSKVILINSEVINFPADYEALKESGIAQLIPITPKKLKEFEEQKQREADDDLERFMTNRDFYKTFKDI